MTKKLTKKHNFLVPKSFLELKGTRRWVLSGVVVQEKQIPEPVHSRESLMSYFKGRKILVKKSHHGLTTEIRLTCIDFLDSLLYCNKTNFTPLSLPTPWNMAMSYKRQQEAFLIQNAIKNCKIQQNNVPKPLNHI